MNLWCQRNKTLCGLNNITDYFLTTSQLSVHLSFSLLSLTAFFVLLQSFIRHFHSGEKLQLCQLSCIHLTWPCP